MIRKTLLVICLLAGALKAETPLQPGPEISTLTEATSWVPLLARLASRGPIYSVFTEKRWFPFRREPVVLQGELRFSHELGLSLRYTKPVDNVLVIDSSGLLMRDARGHQRTPPSNGRVSGLAESMLAVMQFDLDGLLSEFVVHAARSGDHWRIDLEPRQKQKRRVLQGITVFGSGDEITELVFEHSKRERVEVDIHETRTVTAFSASDRKRYFR